MALVGIIEQSLGHVIKSARFAQVSALMLVAQDESFGHILFEGGAISSVQVTTGSGHFFSGEAALTEIVAWERGFYTMFKRSEDADGQQALRVVVTGLPQPLQKKIEGWLKTACHAPSVVGLPHQIFEVVHFLQPDTIIMGCPLSHMGLPCGELLTLLGVGPSSPLQVMVLDEEVPLPLCSEAGAGCRRRVPDQDGILALLARHWRDKLERQPRNDLIATKSEELVLKVSELRALLRGGNG